MSQHEMIDNDKRLLFLLHIMKTGGTTLTDIVTGQYTNNVHFRGKGWSPQGILDYKDQIEKADTFCGHYWFGGHQYITGPFTYITMLRDPVEQVISWFYFRYRSPKYDHFAGNFSDYINSQEYPYNYLTSNLQTRFICGDHTPDLETAKYNLQNFFSVAGLTERFDESIFLMKQTLGWKNTQYQKRNVNQKRPLKHQFPQFIIDQVEEKNALDRQLYNYASQKLDEQLQALDPKAKRELEAFKHSQQ
ncbi:sulfotransferase family 2 domain-containing protein [Tuberibacillus sp. Marseille-P3662]|uniref:sulfotransferase family 2 domain-containing protein n=1 Tax=Tuberibacillus sp. Marseille-P3662 TaxID=1965358 RepID=UPI000A1CC980|nr:sulfotransferase family 2 domain-containing protein [Tuberibacillus sp. Marseille-P3662]